MTRTVAACSRFLRAGIPAYRHDIDRAKYYQEHATLRHAVRATIDVPFSHGTLAVSSPVPNAFTRRDIVSLQGLAEVLSDGFRRLDDLQALEQRNQELELEVGERRQAEKELLQHREHLQDLVEARTADVQARNRELEAFSYSVSHDLRAPLRAIRGFAQILEERYREPMAPRAQHFLDNIVEASGHMEQLIEDLLQYSRLGRQRIRREAVDLSEVLEQVEQSLASRLHEHGIALRAPDEQVLVRGTPTLLSQIFTNLLDNALTYKRPDVPLRLDLTYEVGADRLVVTVEDNGIGIAPEFHDKVFDMFQRLHPDHEYPGTGVGLAIVRKAAELLRGRVWVESEPEQGSRFFVELPRATGLERDLA